MSHVKMDYFVSTRMNNHILSNQMKIKQIKLQLTCFLSCQLQVDSIPTQTLNFKSQKLVSYSQIVSNIVTSKGTFEF